MMIGMEPIIRLSSMCFGPFEDNPRQSNFISTSLRGLQLLAY